VHHEAVARALDGSKFSDSLSDPNISLGRASGFHWTGDTICLKSSVEKNHLRLTEFKPRLLVGVYTN
jgi:hypothetical protein